MHNQVLLMIHCGWIHQVGADYYKLIVLLYVQCVFAPSSLFAVLKSCRLISEYSHWPSVFINGGMYIFVP
jgi:hypothetical protein